MIGAWRAVLLSLFVGIVLGSISSWKVMTWYHDSQENKAWREQVAHMRDDQAKASKIAQENLDAQIRISDGLAADLERLRKRPPRVLHTPATCEGSTGAELSGPDAGFLARLAARADRIRSAYDACQKYADAVSTRQ